MQGRRDGRSAECMKQCCQYEVFPGHSGTMPPRPCRAPRCLCGAVVFLASRAQIIYWRQKPIAVLFCTGRSASKKPHRSRRPTAAATRPWQHRALAPRGRNPLAPRHCRFSKPRDPFRLSFSKPFPPSGLKFLKTFPLLHRAYTLPVSALRGAGGGGHECIARSRCSKSRKRCGCG
jgi:hypothetical protein